MGGRIISTFIMGMVGAIFVGLGAWQKKSSTPATFYSGEKPLKKEQLTDVEGWNRAHGNMWLLYGGAIWACQAVGLVLNRDALGPLLSCGVILGGLPLLVLRHHSLLKQYLVSREQ